jgi:hypothetical protein
MFVQLVHESVLTVGHYLNNVQNGIYTVMLVPVDSREDAVIRLRAFSDRIRQKLPAMDSPELTAYCCGSNPIKCCGKLHSHIESVIAQANPKTPKVIDHRRDWQK